MYSKIIDPISNNKYNINTSQAKKILKKYILKAGSLKNYEESPSIITDDNDDLAALIDGRLTAEQLYNATTSTDSDSEIDEDEEDDEGEDGDEEAFRAYQEAAITIQRPARESPAPLDKPTRALSIRQQGAVPSSNASTKDGERSDEVDKEYSEIYDADLDALISEMQEKEEDDSTQADDNIDQTEDEDLAALISEGEEDNSTQVENEDIDQTLGLTPKEDEDLAALIVEGDEDDIDQTKDEDLAALISEGEEDNYTQVENEDIAALIAEMQEREEDASTQVEDDDLAALIDGQLTEDGKHTDDEDNTHDLEKKYGSAEYEYEYDQDGNCYVTTLNGTTAIPAGECAKLGHPYNKMVKSNECLVELNQAKLTISDLTNKLDQYKLTISDLTNKVDQSKLTISDLTNKLDQSNKKLQYSKNNINRYYEILQQLQSKLDSSIGDYERLFFR